MTGEGKEYGRRKREGSDEETDRRVRETIDEMKEELENKENPERRELPDQVYNPEKSVREAIEEVVREQEEEQRLKEQQETEKEEPKESKEKREISEEWDVDRCVKEAIEEVQQEEIERQRLREEREHAEKEQQLESSREAREETADKDNLEDYEEEIKKGYEKHGIDPEELEERWRKKFEEEVRKELGEEKESRKETEGKEDESAGQERSAEGHHYYDDGSGQVYEVQMDSKESTSAETESSTETQEVQEEPTPESEQKKEVASEIREAEVENNEDTKQEVPEKTRNSDTQPESAEPEEAERVPKETPERSKRQTTVDEYSTEESQVEEPKKKQVKQESDIESQEVEKSEQPEIREEHEDPNHKIEDVEEPLRIDISEDTSDTHEHHPEYSIEVPEDIDKHIEELLEDLIAELESEEEEQEVDESRIIVDSMTGREYVDRTYENRPYFQDAEEETEEQERVNLRARLEELFGELSEDEREKLKEKIRSRLKSEEDLDELIERNSAVRASPDYKEKYAEAKEYMHGNQQGEVPKLIKELLKDEVERVWSKFVLRVMNLKLREKIEGIQKKRITETKQQHVKFQRTLDGMGELGDAEQRLSTTYLNEIIKGRESYSKDISRTEKFFLFVKELKNSSNLVTATRRAGLRDNQSKDWVYRGKLPFLVRTALSVPTTKPTMRRKWLPTKVTMGRKFKQYIQVPTRINSRNHISQVLRQLKPLDESVLRKLEKKLGLKHRTPIEQAFMYFLGLLISDGAFDKKDGLSTRVSLSLGEVYPWSKQVGLAFRYCLALMGIGSKQQKSTESTNKDGSVSTMLKWQSESSPLFVWIRKTVLGLTGVESKSEVSLNTDWMFTLPNDLQKALLQGIAEGDGWASIRTLEAGITSTTNQTMIAKIMTSLGIESKIYGNDVRISKKKALEKAMKLPFFKNARGRQRRLEEICKMLSMMSSSKRKRIVGSERETILRLSREGLSSGEITSILWAEYGIARRPKTIQRFIRRNIEF